MLIKWISISNDTYLINDVIRRCQLWGSIEDHESSELKLVGPTRKVSNDFTVFSPSLAEKSHHSGRRTKGDWTRPQKERTHSWQHCSKLDSRKYPSKRGLLQRWASQRYYRQRPRIGLILQRGCLCAGSEPKPWLCEDFMREWLHLQRWCWVQT